MAILFLALVAAVLQDGPDREQYEYRALVRQLSEDDLGARDEAVQRLRKAGRRAFAALAESGDPEARDLLASMKLRRRLSHRVLEAYPTAVLALRSGSTLHRADVLQA